MSLSKKVQNVVISLDTHNYKITVFQNFGTDFNEVNIEEFTCDESLIQNKKVFEILDSVLSAYLVDKTLENPDVYVVLPDYFVSTEHIQMPLLPATKMRDALKNELKKLYPNFKELEINSKVLSKTKRNVIYSCVMIKKYIVTDCVSAVKKHNLTLKNITFHSNAIANAMQALGSKTKHTSHILADIGETRTHLVYVSKDKMLCFDTLPFGANALLTDKQVSEYAFFDGNEAEKTIFLAKKKAKEKNLSPFEITDEISDEVALDKHFSQVKKQKNQLSKFLTDDTTSPLLQNFGNFSKHILLMKNSVVVNYDFPSPEFVVINLPPQFFKIFGELKTIGDLKVKNFDDEMPKNFSLNDYLELYGAIYAVAYNKNGNFLEREKQSLFGGVMMEFSNSFKKFSGTKNQKK